MSTYIGMVKGKSYAFIELPISDANIIMGNVVALGWILLAHTRDELQISSTP